MEVGELLGVIGETKGKPVRPLDVRKKFSERQGLDVPIEAVQRTLLYAHRQGYVAHVRIDSSDNIRNSRGWILTEEGRKYHDTAYKG